LNPSVLVVAVAEAASRSSTTAGSVNLALITLWLVAEADTPMVVELWCLVRMVSQGPSLQAK
jgi:hypothetical protein